MRPAPVSCLLATTTLASVLLAGFGSAEQRQFRGRTDLVRFDVLVLDDRELPVRGLTIDDFVIVDDGIYYPAELLEEYVIEADPPARAGWTRDIASDVETNVTTERRLFIIVLDDAMLPPDSFAFTNSKTAAHAVIDRLAPSDRAAIVFTLDSFRSQNFTSDRARLHAAVDRLTPGFIGDANPKRPDGFTDEHYMRASVGTLAMVAEALVAENDLRKILVLISVGVPGSDGAVVTRLADSDEYQGQLFNSVLQQRRTDLFTHAQRANVAVYGIDPFGLVAPSAITPVWRHAPGYLKTVATNTGGFAVTDTNDVLPGIERLFAQNRSYYVIAYTPKSPPTPGRFRGVEVRALRPGLTVHARRGYYGPGRADSGEAGGRSNRAAIDRALSGVLPAGEMPMQAHVAPLPLPGRRHAALIVTTALGQPGPTSRIRQDVEVVISAFDYRETRGRSAATRRQKANLLLVPSPHDVRYEVLSRLDVGPGRYQVRVAGHNPSLELAGSVYADVDVPDFTADGVRLSGLFVGTEPAPESAPRNALTALLPIVPTTLRTFGDGTRATAFVRVVQGGRSPLVPVRVVATIRDGSDRLVYERAWMLEPDVFVGQRQADVPIEIPVDDLEAGPHLLEVSVPDHPGHERVRRLRFSR